MSGRTASGATSSSPWIALLLRHRFVVLSVLGLALIPLKPAGATGDWPIFVQGAKALLGTGFGGQPANPLSLYADVPGAQVGPATFLVSIPFTWISADIGRRIGVVLMVLALPLCLFWAERISRRCWTDSARLPAVTLVGGAAVTLMWTQLAVIYAHLDDVMVLVLVVWALDQTAAGRGWTLGVAVGVGTCCKPWAASLIALAFALSLRQALIAVASATAVVAALWLPFFLGDLGTFHALEGFRVAIMTDSPLAQLGLHTGVMPGWDRPLQFVAALALGAVAARTGRWWGVPVIMVGMRTLLDPQTFLYYYTGLVFALLLFELIGTRRRFPFVTVIAVVVLYDVRWVVNDVHLLAVINAAVSILAMTAVFLVRGHEKDLRTQETQRSQDQGREDPLAVVPLTH